MKKRILSILLCCVMLMGLLPTAAFAADKHPAEPSALAGAQAVSVQSNDAHTAHCVCGGKVEVENHKHETSPAAWQSWDGTGEITYTGGSARVYLTEDVSANLTVPSGSTLTLCLNGKAFRCKDKSLAAITLEGAALNLCDCVGTGTIGGRTSGEKGGSIQARFSTVNLYGGTLIGNSGLSRGGGISFEGGSFTMYGGAISGNSAQFGGGIFGGEYSSNLGGNAYINIFGGEISGNTASEYGGGFYAATGFIRLFISGGLISGNRADGNGGGLSVAAGWYNITGGIIQNNSAGNEGGGIYGGCVNGSITGGEITGNTAKRGGGIYEVKQYSTPIAYYSDCTITGNSATEMTGGVYFEGSMPEMVVYGDIYISGNTLNGKPSNLCTEKSNMRYLIGDPMGENARVDISFTGLASGEIIRSSSVGNYYTTKADIAKFRSETEGVYIVASEQPDETYGYTGLLSVSSNHKHCACGGDVAIGDHTTHTEQTFLPWSGGDAGYKNGVACVYLKQNITLNSNLTVTGGNTLYLCLHGNTISSNGTNKIVVEKGSRLVICDCSGGGVIKGATKGWGGTGIYVYQSTLDIFGGMLTGGKVNGRGGGGAIALDDKKCVLNIYGGEISGNNGNQSGGAIFLNNKDGCGTVNLYGGKICNNTATNGGAIYAANGGTINLIGGEISGNTSGNDGGAVYAGNGASIKITGTKLIENKARYGGAICLIKNCSLVMEKGEISKNEATEGGAVSVFDQNSTFTLVNGSITGNSATDGGAVYLNQDNSIFNMGGGTISGNTATGNGGAVYTYRSVSVMTMSGGTIENNTAGKNGGAVYINKGQLNLMDAPVIRSNTVSGKANNVYLKNGMMLTAYYFKSTEKIGVTTETTPTKGNPVVFCNDSDQDYSDYFFADDPNAHVEYNSDKHLQLAEGAPSPITYTVTLPSDTGYTAASAEGSTSPVASGGSFSFTVTILDNYQKSDAFAVKANGTLLTETDGKYTISNIIENQTVTVEGIEEIPTVPTTYTVTFVANGGTGTMAPVSGVSGAYTLPACGFTAPDNKEFKAWSIDGIEYDPGATITVSDNITVTALWKDKQITPPDPTTYTVSFDANGGTGTMAPVSGVSGAYTLPACGFTAPDNKEFKAWSIGDIEYDPGATITVSDNITVTAIWKDKQITPPDPTTYTVSFDANGGTGTMEPVSGVSGAYTLPACDFTAPDNKEFKAWSIDGIEYDPGATITVSDNITVTAIWKDKQITPPDPTAYTVSFNANGGSVQPASMTTGTDGKLTSLPTPARDGSYRFDGWYTEKSGGERVTTETVFDTDTTVYAHWTYTGGSGGGGGYTCYTLTFETNGGSTITSERFRSGTMVDLTKYAPIRKGCTFTGWYSNKGLTSKITSIRLDGNKTVYAGWQKQTAENPFTDVSKSDWFYDGVRFVYETGLMVGTSDTLFSPYGTATRAMMATVLWRMEGSPAPKNAPGFTDVASGKWYSDAIAWTTENGIYQGYGSGKFGPDDPITREQLAAIFYRYADYKGYDRTIKGSLDNFKDKVSTWAQDAMQWAVGSSLMKGKGSSTLDPQGTATRAEIAAMLHRFIEKYGLAEDKAPAA